MFGLIKLKIEKENPLEMLSKVGQQLQNT